jgi:hypothetical protein
MVRTQIYLTKQERARLKRLAARTGKSQSEIIRAAVDHWLERGADESRRETLKTVAGIWQGRTDLPDFRAVRREADRIRPARRP